MSLFGEWESLDDTIVLICEIAQGLPDNEHVASAIIASVILAYCRIHNINQDDFMARMVIADKLARADEED